MSSLRFVAGSVIFLAGGAGLAGCGTAERSGERVAEDVRRSLPTQQHALAEEVCPEHLGMPPKQETKTRRRGERQLDALVDAYRSDPDALIRTSYSPADDGSGIRHEDLSVEELLDTHLSTAEEIAEGGEQYGCFERVAETLRDVRR